MNMTWSETLNSLKMDYKQYYEQLNKGYINFSIFIFSDLKLPVRFKLRYPKAVFLQNIAKRFPNRDQVSMETNKLGESSKYR